MKNNIPYVILFFVLMFTGPELVAQYGYGGGGYGYGNGGYGNSGYGRQRSAIPQVQETPKEPEAKTAAQIVDGEMPRYSRSFRAK
ncbi:hypothetical protein [Zobellia laminariae]|uniref:hypothetical protein n=1 Tax=Zobellia laminariae TaxID=248906 RepID=UPI0026F42E32|nr:hypothetical protein [Zobellia laminariae]WKX75683.1 hypothetical protein Q5W13_18960 [Zobellia laminariae]